ncbi:MAG TPA: SDR family oxidoreductase [Actinobacteria bacterium]|jgi:glucose 1-dehydrogenase|nr:SDR family oxidoreductase [Actinomycetota bacterium]
MRLKNKWALITGGGRGIGKGISIELAKEGCNVVVNYVSDPGKAEETVKELKNLGVQAYSIKADVSNRCEVDRMISEIISKNELDILINNAGVVKFEPFLEITKEAWDFQMNINLVGAFNVGQEVARYLVKRNKGGKIVFVTSFNQEVPNGSQGVYSITKSAIKMLAKSMALELAEYKINVNTIAAGAVITDINKVQIEEFPGLVDRLNKIIPLHRWGTPEDMGKAAVFLSSADCDYVTGSTIFVEGGIMINNGMLINVSEQEQ